MVALESVRDLCLPKYRVVTTRELTAEEKDAATRGHFTTFGNQVDLRALIDWNQNPRRSRSGVYELHTLHELGRIEISDGDE